MTTISSHIASALGEVPRLLLDAEHRDVLKHACSSLEELEAFEADPGAVVVVGGGGSGKSSVVNALVGAQVVSVSPVRPTTIGISVIGRSGPTPMEGTVEYVFTDLLPDGVVVVDTPSWDHQRDAVSAAVLTAHTVVVVLTPTRYADAVTAEFVRDLPDVARVLIVANRMPADPDESDDVLDEIESSFDIEVFATVIEGEAVELPGSLIDQVPVDTEFVETKRSLARTVAGSGRRIARYVSASAAELGEVQRALGEVDEPSCDRGVVLTGDDWRVARGRLVDLVAAEVSRFDAAIVERSNSDLAPRIREFLGELDTTALPDELDVWRVDTTATFRTRCTTRWRRKSTIELLDRWSWVLCVDPQAPAPRRARRAMRDSIEPTVVTEREVLFGILDAAVRVRRTRWASVAADIGEYRPGVLFAASDALDGGGSVDA